MIPPTLADNPFPGLRPYEPNQADLFFGRDEQTEELAFRLQKHRFVAVVGTSGSGKSSLVRAGLIPILEHSPFGFIGSNWRIAILRPGRNAIAELASTLSSTFGDPQETVLETLSSSSAGLAKYARQSLGANENLLILVDQFEELFRYRENKVGTDGGQSSAAFVKLLLAATAHNDHPLPTLDDVPAYVVITMRSDFLGRCSQFRGLPEVLNDTQYLVPRMTRDEQREAIEGPVGMAGARMSGHLVQRLLNEVSDKPDQLPVLQHVLMRIWENSHVARAQGDEIQVKDYDDVGGMDEALNRDADNAFAVFKDDEQSASIARRLFQRLVDPGAPDEETRHPTPLSEIVAIVGGDETAVRKVISVFAARGFLTLSSDDDPIVDISHESLIRNWKKLGEWVAQESRSAQIYRRLVDNLEQFEKHEGNLLIDPQLQLALNWRKETHPNLSWAARYNPGFDAAMKFLDQSKKARDDQLKNIERQRERNLRSARWTAVVFAGLFVVALVASVVAAVLGERARQERIRSSRVRYDANVYAAHRAVEEHQFLQADSLLREIWSDSSLKKLCGFEWFHLWQVVHGSYATLSGHSAGISWVAFSPDGKTLASSSEDMTVKLWDTSSHNQLATFKGHSGNVTAIAFSPDGTILASGSLDKTVKLWNLTSRAELTTLTPSVPVRGVAFSPDGRTLAVCGDGTFIKLWNTSSYKELATLKGHTDNVSWVAFSPDGHTLVSSSEDNVLILWDVATGKQSGAAIVTDHSGPIWMVSFSPNGRTLASSSDDNTVKLWDIESHKLTATLSGHSASVNAAVFSPDGKTLATASSDSTVIIWDMTSLKAIATLTQFGPVQTVAFSPDGHTIAAGSSDTTVRLWNPTSPKSQGTLDGQGEIFSIAFSPVNDVVAAATNNIVRLWDSSSRMELAKLEGHLGQVKALAFSPDGKTIATGGVDSTIKMWDVNSHEQMATLEGHSQPVLAVTFSPDGKILASGGTDDTIFLWDIPSGRILRKLVPRTGRCAPNSQAAQSKKSETLSCFVRTLSFSQDGKTLASNADNDIKLWNIESGNELKTLSGHSESVTAVAFSPNGKLLASASLGGKVKLWDPFSGQVQFTYTHELKVPVVALAFSPDGKTLASAGLNSDVKLWDPFSPREFGTLTGHESPINALAFSRNAMILASGGSDSNLILWLAPTEVEIDSN